MTIYPLLHQKLPKIVWDSDAFVAGTGEEEVSNPIFSASGWTRESSYTASIGYQGDKFGASGTSMSFEDAQLGIWLPDTAGPYIREGSIWRMLTGYTPGEVVGVTFNTNWILHLGAGKFYVEFGGTRVYMSGPGATIWNAGTIDTSNNKYLRGVADGSGEIEIRFGVEGQGPSFNDFIIWEDGEASKLQPSALLFVMPPGEPMVYSHALEPFQQVESAAGFRDGWAEDQVDAMDLTVHAIPYKGNSDDRSLWWGWDGAGGWSRFLQYFNLGNRFNFYPDQEDDEVFYTCVAKEKAQLKPDPDWVGHKKVSLKFRTIDDSVIVGY